MAIRALVINETDHWSDDVKAKKLGGKICGCYLYRDDLGVHCCELTASFECRWVEDVWDVPNRDELDEYEVDEIDNEIKSACTDQDVQYWHVNSVRSLPERPEGSFDLPDKAHTFEVYSDEELEELPYDLDNEEDVELLWEGVFEYAHTHGIF